MYYLSNKINDCNCNSGNIKLCTHRVKFGEDSRNMKMVAESDW